MTASTYKSTTFEATALLMGLNTIAYVHLSSKPAFGAAFNIVLTQVEVHTSSCCTYVHVHTCIICMQLHMHACMCVSLPTADDLIKHRVQLQAGDFRVRTLQLCWVHTKGVHKEFCRHRSIPTPMRLVL